MEKNLQTNKSKRVKTDYDIIIIGAGAAGLLAAHFCSKIPNKKILLLDHNKQVGRKILISGGGRCNFTNIYSSPDFFYSSNPHFCKSALSRYTPWDFLDLIQEHKIEYYEKKLGQLFCKNSAKDIVSMLLKLIDKNNVDLKLEIKNLEVSYKDETFVTYNDEYQFSSSELIIATGGLSVPPIGATGFGHQIAKQFGHKIIPATPALVPFKVSGFETLKGISLVAKLSCNEHSITEDLLFTHKGISGPAVLKISLYWNPADQIQIDWLPELNIVSEIEKAPNKTLLKTSLKRHLPNNFVDHILEKIGIDGDLFCSKITKKELSQIEKYLHHSIIVPSGTEGFRKAEVTRGGIDTFEVSSKTMQSNYQKGLYFIGEVLDVTGQLGGHNFQWAWASAFAVSQALQNQGILKK